MTGTTDKAIEASAQPLAVANPSPEGIPSDSLNEPDGTMPAESDDTSSDIVPGEARSNDLAPTEGGVAAPANALPVRAGEVIADGQYVLSSYNAGDKALEVRWGSTQNGAPTQIYEQNDTPAQRWEVASTGDGFYTIRNTNSGKFLDIPGAQAESGRRLQQYEGNGTQAQQWRIVADASRAGYYVLLSRIDESLALDICGAGTSNGTGVQLYTANGTGAQSFFFHRLASLPQDGVYTIMNAGSEKQLDVSGASLADSANVQQYKDNGTLAQKFKLERNASDGSYTIVSVQSGKVLDVAGGRSADGTNVQQYSSNGSAAQRWYIRSLSDGSFAISSALDGRVLDVRYGSTADGANVQTYSWNGSAAQRWIIDSAIEWLPSGSYEIASSKNVANAISAQNNGLAGKNAVTTKVRSSNDGLRKWQLVWERNGYAHIINLGTGKALSSAGENAPATLRTYDASDAQQWLPVATVGGIKLQSKLYPGLMLDIYAGSTETGATVQTYASNDTAAQRFVFVKANLLATGRTYTIRSIASNENLVLDVPGASTVNGKNLQLYPSNGTNAQVFYVSDAGNGNIQIRNVNSGLYLTADTVNGPIWQSNPTDSRSLWTVTFDRDVNSIRIHATRTGGVITGMPDKTILLTQPSGNDAREGFAFLPSTPISKTTLRGIDISEYQDGIDLSRVASDFVIVKATQGTYYKNSVMSTMADQALSLGRKLGLYHFIDANKTAAEQARYFVNFVKDYIGKAMLILDWEDDASSDSSALRKGPSFAKEFLDNVFSLTGVRPLIYMSKSVTAEYNWQNVADASYDLWVAQYASMDAVNGYQDNPWTDEDGYGAWSKPVMFQYTPNGRLEGYDHPLDLNVFYGKGILWDSYITPHK